MTLTINTSLITSDQTGHTAQLAPGGQHAWHVSWLPGQLMDRNTAITAMMLADAATRDPHAGQPLGPHIHNWAEELGLPAADAITRASEPPEAIHGQKEAPQAMTPDASGLDPEAEP
jgi:hypothetical protein